MKKRTLKILTVVMTLALALSMTISAYAFEGKYFSTAECWDYTEEETTIANAVEAVVGKETYPDENAAGINNYNVYAIEMDIQGMDTQTLYDSMITSFESEFKTGLENTYSAMGWAVEFVSFNTSLKYDKLELYQYICLESEQKITDDSGNATTVYQNMAVFPANTYAVYVTVTNYDGATECQEVLNEVVDYIYIENYCYGDVTIDFTDEELEEFGKIGVGILVGVLVFFLVILVVIIVIIVLVVKASKKKKAQRMAQQQQYNPYGYNPNGQYNPYGQQAPVNNNQYNPNQYNNGQQFNSNQYSSSQSNNYAPYTPSQPASSEIKDPLDLDNKE